jgi:hypothetical protein
MALLILREYAVPKVTAAELSILTVVRNVQVSCLSISHW